MAALSGATAEFTALTRRRQTAFEDTISATKRTGGYQDRLADRAVATIGLMSLVCAVCRTAFHLDATSCYSGERENG